MHSTYKKDLKLIREKATGVIMDYVSHGYQKQRIDEYEIIDNYEFNDTFEFVKFEGYSGLNAKFKSMTDGNIYHVFMSEFEPMFVAGLFNGTKITGKWSFRKQGKAFSLIKLND